MNYNTIIPLAIITFVIMAIVLIILFGIESKKFEQERENKIQNPKTIHQQTEVNSENLDSSVKKYTNLNIKDE